MLGMLHQHTHLPSLHRPAAPHLRPPARFSHIRAAHAAAEVLDWATAVQHSRDGLGSFTLLPGVGPSTAPAAILPTLPLEQTISHKPVLLYRDTNAWCPFCERVWLALEEKDIPYDTVLINLRDKPEWYTKMVPTELVPGARINGEMVYESDAILQKLEEQFSEMPLLPDSAELRQEAQTFMDGCGAFSSAGYAFLAGGRRIGTAGAADAGSPKSITQLREEFEEKLSAVEAQLAAHSDGPYFMGEFGMADIMYVPALERFAANLPMVHGFCMRDNPAYPLLGKWYAAVASRPAYQRVSSDDSTLNLLIRKIFGVQGTSVEEASPENRAARMEAAAKIAANRAMIAQDILKNGEATTPALQATVS